MRCLLIALPCIFLFARCAPEEIPFQSNDNLLVVSGWLTDIDTFQFVELARTQSFEGSEPTVYVSDAEIQIVNLTRNVSHSLEHKENGTYSSNTTFAGIPRHLYQLRITLEDGSVIISENELMPNAPVIDSVRFGSYLRESLADPDVMETVYYPIAQFQDPADIENYYRWRVFRNDTLFNLAENMVLISDRFFDGNAPTLENEFTQFEYALNDTIKLEMLEISKTGFRFLTQLKAQIITLGTVSSLSPAPIFGNLSNTEKNELVLGFWGTSSSRKGTVVVK